MSEEATLYRLTIMVIKVWLLGTLVIKPQKDHYNM